MKRVYCFSLLGTLLLLAGGFPFQRADAQTDLKEVQLSSADVHKPVCVAVAPSGDLFAVADQQTNSIMVFGVQGEIRWTAGAVSPLRQPTAVCFIDDANLIFSQRGELVVYHVAESDPSVIDTLADLSASAEHLKSIDRIARAKDSSYLVLDRSRGEVLRFKSDWQFDRVIIKNGDGRGEVWAPADIALDAGGNIIVADAGPYPVQSFSSDGTFQFFGGWNGPEKNRVWQAGCVAASPLLIIWASDEMARQWRLFDRSGTEVGHVPFPAGILRPVALAITPGQFLIVLDDHGGLKVFSLE